MFWEFQVLFEYLITTLETMPMKELVLKYVVARLMHEISKRKGKEPKQKNVDDVILQ